MFLIESQNETINRPLQAVINIVPQRHNVPILSNVLLRRKNGQLSWVSSDIEMQIEASVSLQGEDVEVTLPARKLQEIFRLLPSDAAVRLEGKEGKVSVTSRRSRFALQTLPASDFPLMRFDDQTTVELTLPQQELRRVLNKVAYAMAQQDLRYFMNGVLMTLEDKCLSMVGTDGHRMAYHSVQQDKISIVKNGGGNKTNAIIPRKAILEIIRLLEDTEKEVKISLFKNQVSFCLEKLEITTKLIDGAYPDYKAVIPVTTEKVILNRQEFLGALQRVAILANEKIRVIRLVLKENIFIVSGVNDVKEEAEEEIALEYKGPPIDVGFNANYLMDMLNHATTEQVTLSFNKDSTNAVLTETDHDDFKYIVMPMRI